MAEATINLTIDDNLVEQLDSIANSESLTRTDLICTSIRMYITRKQKLRELFAYGEQVSAKNGFTEEDVMDEIRNYRNTK